MKIIAAAYLGCGIDPEWFDTEGASAIAKAETVPEKMEAECTEAIVVPG